MFEDAIFVSVDCSCSGISVIGTQAFIEVQKSSPGDVVGFCFAKDQVNLDQRPLFGKGRKDCEDFITKRAWD